MKSIVSDLHQIFKSSVSAVLPESLVRKTLTYNKSSQQLTVCGNTYDLNDKNLYLVGAGKAVQNMATEVETILGSKIKQGIISIPEGSLKNRSHNNILYSEGAKNNLPDERALSTAKKIKNLVLPLESNDTLLVLISGGGSALLPLPKEPITLEEKCTLIKHLAHSGADINELNTVRKFLSDLKGGQLAIKAYPAQVISLILSDIVGDPLHLIASGPTIENLDDPDAALTIIKKYNLFEDLPESVKKVLTQKEVAKPFPKERVKNYVIGSNKLSIAAALETAQELNYLTFSLSNVVTGNVNVIAKEYSKLTSIMCNILSGSANEKNDIYSLNIPGVDPSFIEKFQTADCNKTKGVCLVLGGEITVEVKGKGIGGRNQQLALEFSKYIHDIKDRFSNFDIYFLSAGTDGIDGPTNAAGAIAYKNLIEDSLNQNIDFNTFLDNNDSYNFYKTFMNGELHVITGHTNTNVMDVHLIVIKLL